MRTPRLFTGTARLHVIGYRAGVAANRHSVRWPLRAGTSLGAFGAFLFMGV
jgi:hypothetical protein